MHSFNLKGIMKLTSMLVICALFIVVACSEIEPATDDVSPSSTTNQNPSAVSSGIEEDEEQVLRTAEVLNLEDNEGKLSIRYFYMEGPVKTGDAILITTPDGKNMMIDAGSREGGAQVLDILNEMEIDKIDVILNTHPHIDHLGGFPRIVYNKEVERAFMINHPYTQSGAYNDFMSAMSARNIDPVFLEEGDSFELGEHVKIEVLRPIKGELPDAIEGYTPYEINQFSMVTKLTYKENSFLFTGDIYTIKEREMLENLPHDWLEADLLHAPHHGADTSSSSEFVEAVSPQVVVMSNNIFTSFNLMNRYEYYGAEVVSTALHGHLLITSDGKDLEVTTEKDWEHPLSQ